MQRRFNGIGHLRLGIAWQQTLFQTTAQTIQGRTQIMRRAVDHRARGECQMLDTLKQAIQLGDDLAKLGARDDWQPLSEITGNQPCDRILEMLNVPHCQTHAVGDMQPGEQEPE